MQPLHFECGTQNSAHSSHGSVLALDGNQIRIGCAQRSIGRIVHPGGTIEEDEIVGGFELPKDTAEHGNVSLQDAAVKCLIGNGSDVRRDEAQEGQTGISRVDCSVRSGTVSKDIEKAGGSIFGVQAKALCQPALGIQADQEKPSS